MKATQHTTKQPWDNEGIKEEILKNTLRQMKMKTQHSNIYGTQQKQF